VRQRITAENAESAEMKLNEVSEKTIGAAIGVQRELGPGLLEFTCDVRIDGGDRIDLLAGHRIIAERKAVAKLEPSQEAPLLSRLRLSGCHVGLLTHFYGKLLRNGIRRPASELED
jgi:hypothetical protein